MDNRVQLMAGIGIGAALMYVLDPDRGNRRRALMRDKLMGAINSTGDAAGKTSRDLAHRALGLVAELTAGISDDTATDEVIEARVRSKLGRVVSHPKAIKVTVNQGRATLTGPILAPEVNSLLKCVSSVRGITEVENWLEIHQEAGGVPDLQGGSRRPGERIDLLQENWSPATRLLVGVTGGALTLYGIQRRGPAGTLLSAVGAGLILEGITNLRMKRLISLGGGRRVADIEKSLNTAAPAGQVFQAATGRR